MCFLILNTKSWLQYNDIELYSTHNEGKIVVAERFIKTLKNKIYKYMTSVSKKVYIDKLVDIVHKCNNTCDSTIKMKPVDTKSSTYSNKDPKFEIGVHLRTLKYKKIFGKCYTPIWPEQDFPKLENTILWKYAISDLKSILRTGGKLYIKWKSYDILFDS